MLDVCVPELFFETRRDRTGGQFLNCQDRDGTTYVWCCCSVRFGKNSGKIGDGTTWHCSKMILKARNLKKNWV